jgi:hypothetical protein
MSLNNGTTTNTTTTQGQSRQGNLGGQGPALIAITINFTIIINPPCVANHSPGCSHRRSSVVKPIVIALSPFECQATSCKPGDRVVRRKHQHQHQQHQQQQCCAVLCVVVVSRVE